MSDISHNNCSANSNIFVSNIVPKRIRNIFSTLRPEKSEALGYSDMDSSSSLKEAKSKKGKRTCTKFNNGRWTEEEHCKFIEAILKYGNEWKHVQNFVGTRSSTQARSHAQKIFMKIKQTKMLDLDYLDFAKNGIKALQEIAGKIDEEQFLKTKTALNQIAFEKTSKLIKDNYLQEQQKEYPFSAYQLEYLYCDYIDKKTYRDFGKTVIIQEHSSLLRRRTIKIL